VSKKIDFRSDTVTRPCAEMRKLMANATVGDDVFGDDPTVIRLEKLAAETTGHEAALFCSSGTQTNLLALMTHCQRGDEYIVGGNAHTYKWEGGGAAVLGSIQPQPIDFEPDGTLDLDKITAAIKPDDFHFARTRLLALENTTGGKVVTQQYLARAMKLLVKYNLSSHLDGARVANAAVAQNIEIAEITRQFDSVSVCLSKGLGAPVGSVLCARKEFIHQARRIRKMLGGGMRQAGVIAAAAIYALEHNVDRLRDDHDNASYFAGRLREIGASEIVVADVQTNMIFIQLEKRLIQSLFNYLLDKQIIFTNNPDRGRLVIHKDISRSDIDITVGLIRQFFDQKNSAPSYRT